MGQKVSAVVWPAALEQQPRPRRPTLVCRRTAGSWVESRLRLELNFSIAFPTAPPHPCLCCSPAVGWQHAGARWWGGRGVRLVEPSE